MTRSGRLRDEEIAAALADLPGWSREGRGIVRTFACGSFREARKHWMRIADLAEEIGRFPEIRIHAGSLTVRIAPPGGVSERDVELARRIDRPGFSGP